jgi:hypothetical protein
VAIEIDPQATEVAESGSGEVTLMVTACADPAAAARAVRDLVADIWQMPNDLQTFEPDNPNVKPGPNFVSGPHGAPGGVYFYLDGHSLLREALGSIPSLLVEHLGRQGVSDARIVVPTRVDPPPVGLAKPGLILYLLPDPGIDELPASWREAAAEWLAGIRGKMYVDKDFLSFGLAVQAAQQVARQARSWVRLVGVEGVDSGWALRGANLRPPPETPFVALGIGGSGPGVDVIASAEQLIEVGRALAREAAYAFVTIDPALVALTDPEWGQEHFGPPGAATDTSATVRRSRGERYVARESWGPPTPRRHPLLPPTQDIPQAPTHGAFQFPHALVVDAFPWQVVGPRHVARMGGLPQGARQISPEHWEFTIGDLEDWVDPAQAGPIIAAGRRLLEAFLIVPSDVRPLYDERRQSRRI